MILGGRRGSRPVEASSFAVPCLVPPMAAMPAGAAVQLGACLDREQLLLAYDAMIDGVMGLARMCR